MFFISLIAICPLLFTKFLGIRVYYLAILYGLVVVVVGGLVAKLCLTLAAPWTVAHQAPLSVGFSRQGYWSGLPFPSPTLFY